MRLAVWLGLRREVRWRGAHRPQHSSGRVQPRLVHGIRQPCLAVAAVPNDRAQALRVIEVSRVHLRTLPRHTSPQPGDALRTATPHLAQRAVLRAVLQPDLVKAAVHRLGLRGACAEPMDCSVADPLRRIACLGWARLASAVGLRILQHAAVGWHAAAHLERLGSDGTLDLQAGPLGLERLQEEDVTKRSAWAGACGRSACRTRHLEVACAREDDARLHHVVRGEGVQRAGRGRAESVAAIGRLQPALRHRVGRLVPAEAVAPLHEVWDAARRPRERHGSAGLQQAQHCVCDGAAEPK